MLVKPVHASERTVRRRLVKRWYEGGLYWVVFDNAGVPVVIVFDTFAARRRMGRLKSIVTLRRFLRTQPPQPDEER
jgi:hypothetical protein